MQINDFNALPMNDKVLMVNNKESKLLESHPWQGKYKLNLYDLNGTKVHVLINSDSKNIMLAHAIDDSELESLTDSIYMN